MIIRKANGVLSGSNIVPHALQTVLPKSVIVRKTKDFQATMRFIYEDSMPKLKI